MNHTAQKLLTLLLVCLMVLGLAGCGSSSSSSAGDAAPAAQNTQQPQSAKAEATAAPEFVYSATFKNVARGSDTLLTAHAATADGFYATGEEVTGRMAPEDVQDEYFGQYDIREPRIFFVRFDGEVQMLPDYRPVPSREAPEGAYAFSSSSMISALSLNEDGNLLVMETMYTYWDDLEDLSWDSAEYSDHHFYEMDYYLRTLDTTGKELSCAKMDIGKNDYLNSDPVPDGNGNLLLAVTNEAGQAFLCGISLTGEMAYRIDTDDMVTGLTRMKDGSVYAIVWGSRLEMKPLDTETKTLGEGVPLPSDAYYVYSGGGDYPLYYSSGVHFYGFDPASGESTRLFNWMDCDINPDYVFSADISEDGVVRTLTFDFDNSTLKYDIDLAEVSKHPYDGSAQKKELVLATQYLNYFLREAITAFNRRSDNVRITVRDYSEYNTDEDFTAGVTKLTTEMIAGNCPDLIDLSGLPKATFASKGLLEDLYPYLDADASLSRDQFYENVLAAAETDGKLFSTVSYFTIDTVAGASALVGEEPGWTYDDIAAALREMPDGCEIFGATTTRSQVLSDCLGMDLSSFVSWETGEVNFNNDDFLAMLRFAAQFPETYNWELYDSREDDDMVRISEGKQMLYHTNLYSVDSLMYIESSYNGTPVTFIGYPTVNGTGNSIVPDVGVAMTASCSDKDAAWEFLRTFFTEKYAENYVYSGLPVIKSVLEKQLKDATTVKYELDAYGNYKLDANGEKIPSQRYYATGGSLYTYYALSQDMADKLRDLIDTTTKAALTDTSVRDIVLEQAAPYFTGQKSVEETAQLVQSKVNIYVNEQR